MAKRPVFIPIDTHPFVEVKTIDFEWYPGLSIAQKQKSILSLHKSARNEDSLLKPLEISTKSTNAIGVNLSAFNLTVETKGGREVALENIFQASKVFENGGPYLDLLKVSPKDAKKDVRLTESGNLTGFWSKNLVWPLEPKTIFYDWIYLNSLSNNKILSEKLLDFNAFTDIEFNPKKSINCQARSAALYVSLHRNNNLIEALKSEDSFINFMIKNSTDDKPCQGSLF